jgi:hypothetical protein
MAHHHPHQHTPEAHEVPDAWHRHTADEGPPQEEHGGKANPAIIGLSLLATAVFLVLTIAVIVLYFTTYTTRLRTERIESTVLSKDQLQYKLESSEKLREYSWINPETAHQGIVTIPLQDAKQKVIQKYAAR